ncbi:MAG TPA: hypothetical protein VKF38_11415 [Anaerolineaceae bacterium]|nr:hypothetical protein [Anaerolineaceae bacterium]
MSEAKSFDCPKCGSPLMANGTAEIKCPYCGSAVIVPKELRDQFLDQDNDQVSAQDAKGSTQHVQWLVQNGIEVTAKVKFVKDTGQTRNMNPLVILELDVKPKAGKPFFATAFINVPRNAIPRAGDKVQIKYNPTHTIDIAVQIDGQFHQEIPEYNANIFKH